MLDVGQLLYICGLDGDLAVYKEQTVVCKRTLEPTIRGLKHNSGSVVVAGERSLYYMTSPDSALFSQPLRLGAVTTAYMESINPVSMDSSGHGVIFDRDLFILHSLHLAPGAIPLCADQEGWYIFRLPEGSYDLIVQGKTIYHHTAGPLAVAPKGDLWAIGDSSGISVVTREAVNALLGKENGAEVGR